MVWEDGGELSPPPTRLCTEGLHTQTGQVQIRLLLAENERTRGRTGAREQRQAENAR